MKKLILMFAICLFSKNALAESIEKKTAKALENGLNTGLDIGIRTILSVPTKVINELAHTKKTTVWVEGKSLKECMGDKKVLNNNTVQCHSGYFKEAE